MRLLLLILTLAVPLAADEPPATDQGPELCLVSSGSPVALDDERKAELIEALIDYFELCRDYARVTGETPSQDDLTSLWAEHEQRSHALVRMTATAGDHNPGGGGKRLTLLFGFGSDSESGPFPVLARDETGSLSLYIKCPGLTGLLLSCKVHEMLPRATPSPDCGRWKRMQRQLEENGNE